MPQHMYLLFGSCLFWRNKFIRATFDVKSKDYGFDFLVSHIFVLKDFEFCLAALLKMKTQFMLWATKIKFAQIHAEISFSFHMFLMKHC